VEVCGKLLPLAGRLGLVGFSLATWARVTRTGPTSDGSEVTICTGKNLHHRGSFLSFEFTARKQGLGL